MILIKDLQPILVPIFRLGMGFPQAFNILQSTLIILHQACVDGRLAELGTTLVGLMSEFVGKFGVALLEEFAKLELFLRLAGSPIQAMRRQSLIASLGFFKSLCVTFPQFLGIFNGARPPVIRALDHAIGLIPIDGDILDLLMCLTLNHAHPIRRVSSRTELHSDFC
jgi:hypothetical protein